MKRNPDFLLQEVGDTTVLVPVGSAAEHYRGIVRLNETAAFLVKCLDQPTDREGLIHALESEYEGTREQFEQSIDQAIARLREAGAIVDDE